MKLNRLYFETEIYGDWGSVKLHLKHRYWGIFGWLFGGDIIDTYDFGNYNTNPSINDYADAKKYLLKKNNPN